MSGLDADLDRVAAEALLRRSSREDDESPSALVAAQGHIISTVLKPCIVLREGNVELDCAGASGGKCAVPG